MRIPAKCLLVVSILFSVIEGCASTFQEPISLDDAVSSYVEFLSLCDRRLQVVDFDRKESLYYLQFSNGEKCSFSYDFTPLITVSTDNVVCLNGDNTRLATNSSLYPRVSIDNDESIIINGIHLDWKFDKEYISAIEKLGKCVIAIGEIDHSIVLYYLDGRQSVIPLETDPFYHIPSYFQDQLVCKEEMAEAVIAESDGNSCSFVFFTDAHWGNNQKHSPALIKHILDFSIIPWAMFGGDAITTHCETAKEGYRIGLDFQKSFSPLGSKLYCVFGNHDDNSDGQPDKTERHLSDEQVFSYLQSQMRDVQYWDFYNYTFDDIASKTRFICLDTGRLYLKEFRFHIIKTVQFLVEALNGIPKDWHVVLVSHIWGGLTTQGNIRVGIIAPYMKPIIKVLDDYNARRNGKFNYEGKTVEYDFSGAEGHIEYCIGGHTHNDDIHYSEGGIPIVIITTDSQQTINGEKATKGTIEEQSVSIVVTDYSTGSLFIYRIGRGNDTVISLKS